ncbi:ABC transporter ATP-binding protein [Halocatena marina]|uniref:ABC transporter ATP-binding protein n=1 Tax=Halocatena marina TaxID=2934937 RepID=UPI00200DBD82|nr:ATP-binding cassette domain-containing protein [Halocatena marina]
MNEQHQRDQSSITIEAQNVGFTYPDGTEAVQNVSFTVPQGEFFGFLGPNGAGKTTTIKTLVTLLRPTDGQILVNGIDVTEHPRAVRASIGYTAQDTSIDPQLTARENMTLACEAYHVPKPQRTERIDELLELVDLADVADKRADTFSGGMKKRLDVATSLVHEPPLVFLDEPTTGLDPRARLRLWEYFRRINERGTTIFLTTQYLEEADHLCSRLAVIADGEFVASGSPDDLKAQIGGDSLDITLEETPAMTADQACAVIESSGLLIGGESVGTTADGIVVTSPRARAIGTDVLVALREAGATVTGFTVRSPSLDDVFLHYTGGTLTDTTERPPATVGKQSNTEKTEVVQ